MRDMREGVCALCQHNEVFEAIPADFAGNNYEVQAAVTYDTRWLLPGRDPAAPHGLLKAYVCRDCGYVQWFADNPGDVPIDAEHKTRLIRGPETESPFR